MRYLITGVAGFIGNFVAKRLCELGDYVVGVDNLNNYYDLKLKKARLSRLSNFSNFKFCKVDVSDKNQVENLFADEQLDFVIHLAAQAGVRYSLENPMTYIDSNITGFATILEGCRHSQIKHLLYASSSSVYGGNQKIPYSTAERTEQPLSLYAATKKSNELMAHAYSHLYKLPTTGLRFFTVYGPWGRPDMAIFKFVKAILNGDPIDLYNYGKMKRDFTYIDDIVEGIIRILHKQPENGFITSDAENPYYSVFNLGRSRPIELMELVGCIEKALGKKAELNLLPLQSGDMASTFADVSELEIKTGFKPNTKLQCGIDRFVEWYIDFYGH